MRNLITDVPGVKVGNAHDPALASGVTVIRFDEPAVASGEVAGGAPGSFDTALLDPSMTVQQVDAVFLSGGSAFGLASGVGVQGALRAQGRGFAVGPVKVPIVTGAILFDLLNGGNKNWGRLAPYADLGFAATEAAAEIFTLGTVGAGYGATTANLKGGLGSASAITASGFTVGAVVAVNAIGVATMGDSPHFWSAPYEIGQEFGGLGMGSPGSSGALAIKVKGDRPSTTIACVVTDASITKVQARRLALMANDGLALSIRPRHAPFDGDTVFFAGTGRKPLGSNVMRDITEIGTVAADCLARAVARGIYEATSLSFANALPSWKDRFGPK
jgi:D-aminopeptidase